MPFKTLKGPVIQGGRTLAKKSKKSGGFGGKKTKRRIWYADGTGTVTDRYYRGAVCYPWGEHPEKVVKQAKS